MTHIITQGYRKSITSGEFIFYPGVTTFEPVQTIHETRRARLAQLIKKHGGIPRLANDLQGKPSEAAIRQIASQQRRKERGSMYNMGDAVARHIEETLKLPTGWMDTPLSYAEIHGEDDPTSKVLFLMESMTKEQQHLAVRLIATLDQQGQALNTGTIG